MVKKKTITLLAKAMLFKMYRISKRYNGVKDDKSIIRLILNIMACANHVIVKRKKKNAGWTIMSLYFSLYIFSSPVILIKHPLFF